MGADIKQPRTMEDRVSVAEQFRKKPTPSLPVLVDELNDRAGHAYVNSPLFRALDQAGIEYDPKYLE
jgi:hypothetical protein